MCGVRVAIVAESFLPQVNGVSNSVVKVLEHLRRTGHEALVIAPDTPPGEDRAERLHDGVRVHRVPSRMFPKVTTLPLGVPTFRMLRALRGFDPDVVHLASPALLGYGGLHAARRLGVPTVAVYQTDVPGFASSYGIPMTARAAWAWFRHLHRLADRTLAPSTATMESLIAQGIPRVHRWARGGTCNVSRVGAKRGVEATVVTGRQTHRRLCGSACSGEACRPAHGSGGLPAPCGW
ncbi:mannosyltransferase pimB [Mycobacterium tuberculosis GM 1503]|nr:mannosyltransferase pimB [Mycobacterium tuberculosis GM 1503]